MLRIKQTYTRACQVSRTDPEMSGIYISSNHGGGGGGVRGRRGGGYGGEGGTEGGGVGLPAIYLSSPQWAVSGLQGI